MRGTALIRFRITYIANRGTARRRFNFVLSQRQKEVATPWHQFENQGAEQAKHGSCSAWPEGLDPVSKDAQSFRNKGLLVQKPSGITIITTRLSAGAIHGGSLPNRRFPRNEAQYLTAFYATLPISGSRLCSGYPCGSISPSAGTRAASAKLGILLQLSNPLNPALQGNNSATQQEAHPRMKMPSRGNHSKAPQPLPWPPPSLRLASQRLWHRMDRQSVSVAPHSSCVRYSIPVAFRSYRTTPIAGHDALPLDCQDNVLFAIICKLLTVSKSTRTDTLPRTTS